MTKYLLFLFTLNAYSYTILIDPGHGGEDRGAVTFHQDGNVLREIQEKDLTLEISKRIYEKLKKKNYQVYLTRSIDRDVSLDKRAELAEKVKADLFISVHMNSSPTPESHGFETYYLDNHSNVAVKKVEDVENKNLNGEQLIIHQILIDLVVEKTVVSSKSLANSIHLELKSNLRPFEIKDRGHKAGLFYVLALSKRPAVLLEVGFLSNPKELEKLNGESFQQKYSEAVVRGVDKYFLRGSVEKKSFF
jgi:N-acetylmuramoyl-L-alanine amidase